MATPVRIVRQAQWRQKTIGKVQLNNLEKRLLNEYQKGLPLSATPYADIAEQLGTSEALVIKILWMMYWLTWKIKSATRYSICH